MKYYIEFVHEGKGLPNVWTELQSQIYLGSEPFIQNMQKQIEIKPTLIEVPKA